MPSTFSPRNGFLPDHDPLERLPDDFHLWEDTAYQLPKLLLSDHLHDLLADLPPFPVEKLSTLAEMERAMVILSFIGHAYVWGSSEPATHLPARIALPWYEVSQRLERPPVLSYASYALHNWRRLEKDRPVELGNIALLQNFLGGIDEEWFILIHVDIEAKAVPAIAAMPQALVAIKESDLDSLTHSLVTIEESLTSILQSLERMPEHCAPFTYYNRVRPFIHGWTNNPSLPNGLVYEEVLDYQAKGQFFRGETGAQSSIIPALDTLLGVEHADDPLKEYLLEMRSYMPTDHRAFLEKLASAPSLRNFIIQERHRSAALVKTYNACVTLVEQFRSMHLQYAASYIHQQAQSGQANPTDIGTGGTPFMRYLDKHKRETEDFLIGD